MIKIDFIWTITVYLIVTLGIAIGLWIFYNFDKDDTDVMRSENIEQCPFCARIYISYSTENVKICPQCNSFYESIKNGKETNKI